MMVTSAKDMTTKKVEIGEGRKEQRTVKARLRALRQAERETAALADRLEHLRQRLAILQTLPDCDTAPARRALDRLGRAYLRQLATLASHQRQAFALIQTLPRPELRAILIRYYLGGQTWAEVAQAMHYSTRQTLRLHGQALAQLARHEEEKGA